MSLIERIGKWRLKRLHQKVRKVQGIALDYGSLVNEYERYFPVRRDPNFPILNEINAPWNVKRKYRVAKLQKADFFIKWNDLDEKIDRLSRKYGPLLFS